LSILRLKEALHCQSFVVALWQGRCNGRQSWIQWQQVSVALMADTVCGPLFSSPGTL